MLYLEHIQQSTGTKQRPPEGANKPSNAFDSSPWAEAVPKPIMRVTARHFNLSAELCNIIVNCSIWGNWALAVCDEDDCRVSQSSLSEVNINVTAGNGLVVCSGSNQVSRSSVSTNTEALCECNVTFGLIHTQIIKLLGLLSSEMSIHVSPGFFKDEYNPKLLQLHPLIITAIVAVVVVFVTVCAIWLCKRFFSTQCNHHQVRWAQINSKQV